MKLLLKIALIMTTIGCGTTDSDTPVIVTTPQNNTSENNPTASMDVGIQTDTSGAPDAETDVWIEPVIPKELRSVSGGPGDWIDGLNCLSFCVGEGFECENVDGESMGGGHYSWTNDRGDFTTNKQPRFATCEEPIPYEIDDFGDIHDMQSFYCRCLAPTIEIVNVDINNLTSCDDRCALMDHVCEPETPWAFELAGGSATYQGPDARLLTQHGCDAVPPLERTRNGKLYSLSSYECGCTLP